MAKTSTVINVAIFYHDLSKVKITSITTDDPMLDIEEYLTRNDAEYRSSNCSYMASDKPFKFEIDKEIANALATKYTQATRTPAPPAKEK